MLNRKLILSALGIFICYFYYGIVQEKITKSKYGDAHEMFTYIQSLVFVQCIVNAGFSLFMIRMSKPVVDTTPKLHYAICAFSYLAAMICSNEALKYVPYPTQVLGKSCKPIPVMIFGVLFAQKRYPVAKYFFVLLIVLGVSMFLYKDRKTDGGSPFQFGFGEVLLLVSLCMDGTTGAVQDRIRASYSAKSDHMMLNMNLWSMVYLLISLVATMELVEFVSFVQRFPYVLFDMTTFSIASALGQYCIFVTVTEFGPLTCSIVTTTRKFFTILASVLLFQNPMTSRQWAGAVMVFVGIGLDSAFGKAKKT